MKSNKSYVKETLAFVNKVRKQYDSNPLYDLRTGRPTGKSCPVSASLEIDGTMNPYTCATDTVEDESYIWIGPLTDRRKIRQPRAVRRFVRAFDSGRLPEYHI
jgi:hypothetical protein